MIFNFFNAINNYVIISSATVHIITSDFFLKTVFNFKNHVPLKYYTDARVLQSIFYFFGSHDFLIHVGCFRAVLHLFDSFRRNFFFNLATLASSRSANRFSRLPFSLSFAQELIKVNRLHCSITWQLKKSRRAAAHRTRCSCQISVYA